MNQQTITDVCAVYHEGVLTVLDPLTLPDGAQVQIDIHLQEQPVNGEDSVHRYVPFVPAEALDALTGIVSVGGDALEDNEVLYDPDWD